MIRTILYRAKTVYPLGHPSDQDIVRVSQRNNPDLALTGLLMRDHAWWVQLLEGPALHVDFLLDAVETDARGGPVEILMDRTQPERMLGQWTMAYSQITTETLATFEDMIAREAWADLAVFLQGLAASGMGSAASA